LRKVDGAEADEVMRAAGCIPLVPYPGNHTPWMCIHEPCGEQISPLYSNVRRRGAACRTCAGFARGAKRRAKVADEVAEEMRAAGFEPLEPYPGADRRWHCRHEPCGEVRTPTLNQIRSRGTACRPCTAAAAGRRLWTLEAAEAEFRQAGLEPLVPWPGSSTKPWVPAIWHAGGLSPRGWGTSPTARAPAANAARTPLTRHCGSTLSSPWRLCAQPTWNRSTRSLVPTRRGCALTCLADGECRRSTATSNAAKAGACRVPLTPPRYGC
jgi:hypothetical protein